MCKVFHSVLGSLTHRDWCAFPIGNCIEFPCTKRPNNWNYVKRKLLAQRKIMCICDAARIRQQKIKWNKTPKQTHTYMYNISLLSLLIVSNTTASAFWYLDMHSKYTLGKNKTMHEPNRILFHYDFVQSLCMPFFVFVRCLWVATSSSETYVWSVSRARDVDNERINHTSTCVWCVCWRNTYSITKNNEEIEWKKNKKKISSILFLLSCVRRVRATVHVETSTLSVECAVHYSDDIYIETGIADRF